MPETHQPSFPAGVSTNQLPWTGIILLITGTNSHQQFNRDLPLWRKSAAERGPVQRSEKRVRIAAQLMECAGQTTIWAERFDRDLQDVFALRDEIDSAVSQTLAITFRLDTS
jgi:hypothetical protein